MFKKGMKRFLAAVLSCAMVLGNVPASAFMVSAAAETVSEPVAQADLAVSFDQGYAAVGEELSVTVTGGTDVTYAWYIGGAQISNTTSSYTPTEADLENWITVEITSGGSTVSAQMYFSKLPVVYIDTNGQAITSKTEYIDATIKVQGNSEFNSDKVLYEGKTQIRGRGNSTWSMPKKPYRLKLDKKANLLNLGEGTKSKHWVLLANYSDESLMRNTLAYNLSGDMGMPQMATEWTTVIMNGEYAGNYQLCENVRVDEDRIDIFDWEGFAEDSGETIGEAVFDDEDSIDDLMTYMCEEDMSWITSGTVTYNGQTYNVADYGIEVPSIDGGYILELDEYWDEVSKFKTNSSQPIQFKNPEFVYTNEDMMDFVQTYVQAFEDAVQSSDYTAEYNGEDTHYSELYDFDSLVDYWLICELFFQEEINKKSTYMYKDIGELMKMGPIWDMDYSANGEGDTSSYNQWATLYFNANAQAKQWYKNLVQDPYFLVKAQERYWEIRYDQVADMLSFMDESYDYLKESGAANTAKWPYKQTFDQDFSNLDKWFDNHLAWMDTQMTTEDNLASSFYTASSNIQLSLAAADGTALAADNAIIASADYAAEPDSDLLLTVSGGSGTATVYVNSMKYTTVTLGTNAQVTISGDALTEATGTKNVIEVKTSKATNYITVREQSSDSETGVQKSELQALILEAAEKKQSGYTSDSWKVFEAAYTDAMAVALKTTATQEEVNAAADALSEAMAALVETVDPSDSSKDYDVNKITYSAGSSQSGEGIELAFDGNEDTVWHTEYNPKPSWYGTEEALEYFWVLFELEEATVLDAVRYLPRNNNGDIKSYKVEGSLDGQTWFTLTEGDWSYSSVEWQAAEFAPTEVKYVRLWATATESSSGNNRHVSARELRLRTSDEEAVTPTPSVVDKTALNALIAQVQTVANDKDSYTADSYAAFVTAYDAATAVAENENASQTEVDEALAALKNARNNLVAVSEDGFGVVIPISEMIVSAGDSQDGEGPENAIDEDEKTVWHTDWYVGDNHDNHWFQVELKDVYKVDGFCYQPRQDGTENGIIVAYEIYTSLDGSTWTKAAEGKWDEDTSIKKASFDAVEAKYVKLVTVEALSDQPIVFASAAEIRLTGVLAGECTEHTPTLVGKVNPTCTEDGYTGDSICSRCGETLEEGKVIEAAGHVWGEWNVVQEPTEDEDGLKERICSVCDEKETETIDKTGKTNVFVDVHEGDFYYEPVNWAVELGVTDGTSDTTFEPDMNCSRGHIVTFIWRAMGSPKAEIEENPFEDVTEDTFYYDAVLWAVGSHITDGTGDTTFSPNDPCTRAQIVTFIHRLLGNPQAETTENPFDDVSEIAYYYDAVLWAVENQVTQGKADDKFAPDVICNRGEAVTFLYRGLVEAFE